MDGRHTGQYLASLMLSASARTAHPEEVAQLIDFMVQDPDGYTESSPWRTEKLAGPATLVEGGEASWVSTNDTALYGLAAIENPALLGDRMSG